MSDDHYECGMPVIHNRRCTCEKCCPGTGKDKLIHSLKEQPAKTAEELASRIVGAVVPKPKFKVGQIVVMKSIKQELPFRIIGSMYEAGEWFYQWNRKNYAAEHMLRELTAEEKGS